MKGLRSANSYRLPTLVGANQQRTAFTLIELLVVVSIIAILVAMLLPSLQKARETAKSAICIGNLKQLYIANINYAADNSDNVPPHSDVSPGGMDTVYGTFDWPFLLMPYLGYQGTARQYFTDQYNHGSLEIRWYVYGCPTCASAVTYKTFADSTTKASSVWFCPATRGPFCWTSCPNSGTYSALGWGGFIDYAPNSVGIAGYIDANGNWSSGYHHIRVGDRLKTDAAKLVFIGDCYGYGMNMANVPSNRHYAKGYDNTSGRCNVVFWDGHAESCVNLQWFAPCSPPGIYNNCGNERQYPGWKYYAYGD